MQRWLTLPECISQISLFRVHGIQRWETRPRNIKIEKTTKLRSQSLDMVSSLDVRPSEETAHNTDVKKPRKKHEGKLMHYRRRSKDDLDLKTANSSEEEVVVTIPRKKKDMESLITKQAIEIRGHNEMIFDGRRYCQDLINENERCLERIEERDQIIAEKDAIIQTYSIKTENLKSRIERVQLDLDEKEQLLSRTQREISSLKNQLQETQQLLDTLSAEVEQNRSMKSNGVLLKREESVKENTLKRENQRIKSQLTERDNLIAEGRKVLKSLNTEKDQLQQQLRESERACMDKQFTLDKLTREKERDKIQIRQKEMEASGKGQALERIECELRQAREELRNKDSTITTKDRDIERTDRLLRQANEDKRSVELRIEEERRTTQEAISTLRQQKRVCEDQLRRLQANQQAQERTLQNVEADRNRAKQSADILRKDQPWMINKDEIIFTEKVLGTGAWGRVFEGTFRGMKVAVKELHEIIQSAHNKVLFEREITFVTLVRHPCILQFLGVAGYRSTSPLLVTELMDMSLSNLLSRERVLTRSCVVRLGQDIAFGLNYLHCFRPRSIIHRDINPGNIMVWKHGDVWRGKLCDFGSADFVSGNMSVNPGNPFYSAPEVDSPKQTDKVDVFSYGVLLCELCISKPPDPGNRTRQISLVWNEHLKKLIGDCVSENPDSRPSISDVIELLNTLNHY